HTADPTSSDHARGRCVPPRARTSMQREVFNMSHECKLRNRFRIAAVLATGISGGPALAQAEGWYGGLGGGQSAINHPSDALAGNSFDDTNGAWRAFAGYQFRLTPMAVELGYMGLGH